MIIYLNQSMTSLALRIKDTNQQNQLIDWRKLQLLIQPGQNFMDKCFMGSPWILTGCWPGHRTGVDVANPHFDFPTIYYDAQELDADGRIVFLFDQRLWRLPPGRYEGTVRTYPQHGSVPVLPFNLTHNLSRDNEPKGKILPPGYIFPECNVEFPQPCPPPPPRKCCVLARFDIDLGPACHEHIIDQAAVDYAVNICEME